jgi:hypothetical protein
MVSITSVSPSQWPTEFPIQVGSTFLGGRDRDGILFLDSPTFDEI